MGLREKSFSPFYLIAMDKKNVIPKIDELNLITNMIYYKKKKDDKVQEVTEDFLDLLIEAYLLGFKNQAQEERVDLVKLNQAIYKEVGGETVVDRVRTYVEGEDVEALQKVMATEYHRNYNQGSYDGAKTTGIPTMKKWVTMRDDRVRDTHEFLEGVTIPIDEEFFTNDGDHALFPNGFENPSNNINCRCVLEYI